MIAEFLVLVLLPALLLAAAGWDLASYTIPNFLPGLLVLFFAAFALAAHLTAPAIGTHLLAALAALLLGFGLFGAGLIGGGDAKLFAAAALWLGPSDLALYALAASLCGGLLTLLLLGFRKFPLPAEAARHAWLLRLHGEKAGIPYGVALAAGAFLILAHSEIFRIAATA
jgi:prepilin peptidase CpaA